MTPARAKTVALLTGTFDPIHCGHIELAEAVMQSAQADEVWIMVNEKSANSPGEDKPGAMAFEHRLQMAEIATRKRPNVHVYRDELVRQPHSMATFRKLMERHPDNRFVFVVGIDTIGRLDRWEHVESVVNESTFIVATRPGSSWDTVRSLRDRLGPLGQRLDLRSVALRRYTHVTSTDLRAKIANGESPSELDDGVYDYIGKFGLYGSLGRPRLS